jgi:hypothetical protein
MEALSAAPNTASPPRTASLRSAEELEPIAVGRADVHERLEHLPLGWVHLPGVDDHAHVRLVPAPRRFRGRSAHADELELLGGQLVPATVTRPVAGCSDVSDPRVPHVARTRVARAFTPQSVCRSLAVDVELEVVAVWLEVAVHRLRELVAVARNERR